MKSLILTAGIVLALGAPNFAHAGIGEGGGTGLLEVDTPEVLPAGRLSLLLAPRYGYAEMGDTRLHSFVGNLGLTFGLPSGFEASAVLPLQGVFRTDTGSGADALFEEDFSFRARDLELKLRRAFPVANERLRFALQGIATAPIGSDKEKELNVPGEFEKIYTSDEWNYGLMALASLDFTGRRGNAPVRLHLNGGYFLNRNESRYSYRNASRLPLNLPEPADSDENDLLLAGAGLEFPVGRLSAFVELTTEQLVNQRDLIDFQENPITLTPGLRFLFPGGVGLTTALALNLSDDDSNTEFDPNDFYPDWELRAALSFGDVLQSRRARQKRTEPDLPPGLAPVVETQVDLPEDAPAPTGSEAAPGAEGVAEPTVLTPFPSAPGATLPGTLQPGRAAIHDTDGDGILDPDDRCPLQKEDRDGFRDSDGCPDLDNDQDGILDLDDLCPNTPEDHRGPNPNDGCPSPSAQMMSGAPASSTDLSVVLDEIRQMRADAARVSAPAQTPEPEFAMTIDRDGDLIPDVSDACPLQAEDVDGWQDADGCPDLDNDQDGILDNRDRCPNAAETWNGYQDEDGCPDSDQRARSSDGGASEELISELRRLVDVTREGQGAAGPAPARGPDPTADWDDDGVGDAFDRCPEIPEDIDGWQDEDGCPDLDNDGDGFRDRDDACPNAPETFNGFQDEDGCPDTAPQTAQSAPPAPAQPAPAPPARPAEPPTTERPAGEPARAPSSAQPARTVERHLGTVYFDAGGSSLSRNGRSVLGELEADLNQAAVIRVEGHSDNRGNPESNWTLSLERARSVAAALSKMGIDAAHIEIAARGEADPVEDNGTSRGRARNRRVEIFVQRIEGGSSR